jgi:hypothetical protein
METQAYLWHYLVAGAVLVLIGALAHIVRAVVNIYPDRLSDRPLMDMMLSDGYDLGDRIFGTEYDDAGYYKLDSVRNLRNSVAATLVGGWAAMLLAPGLSGFVAQGINTAILWTWELFLYRLGDIKWV